MKLELPNGRLLTAALMADHNAGFQTSIVRTSALRAVVGILISQLPFDEAFYLETYPDIRQARATAEIDPHTHFVQHGYFEGRLGAKPEFDENFYRIYYPDVGSAIRRGEFKSELDHFIRTGAEEGRFASKAHMETWMRFSELLAEPRTALKTVDMEIIVSSRDGDIPDSAAPTTKSVRPRQI